MSMFPYHKSDELWFPTPSNQNRQHEIHQDTSDSVLAQIQGTPSLGAQEKIEESSKNIKENERIPHKEIERRRRKEMSDLFTSLRSILPYEFIKGKRSKSDHMLATINYIKQLEKNIEELKIKRDKLNKLSYYSQATSSGSSSSCLPNVLVSPCRDGLEVLITCSCGEDEVPFSRVLNVLRDEGLNVVSFMSIRVNERLLQTIKSEVSDMMFDSLLLQQKLMSVLLT